MSDPVLALAHDFVAPDKQPLLDFGIKYAGILSTTSVDRIQKAAADEVADLVQRARAAVEALPVEEVHEVHGREALDVLGDDSAFPRTDLEALAIKLRDGGIWPDLAELCDDWVARHRALERRLGWLLRGTPPKARAALDPIADADQLHHVLTSAFRFEARVLEMLAINRIAQAPSLVAFFRSTKEAELNAVSRFFDTYQLYGSAFEWGIDSLRGRTAIERMNQIHGRYYIPNVEMKFVLLQGAFTWLDGAARIGHRPISDQERRGMVASWVALGRAMHIQDLSDDYEESYGWYRDVCEAHASHSKYKTASFETIVSASVSGQLPALRKALFTAAKVAMDDTYRAAVGYDAPSKEETQAVRAVFFTVGSLIEQLPYAPYLRSIHKTPIRKEHIDPGVLGTPDRSVHMPAAFPDRPNLGFPEWQVPLARVEDAEEMELPDIPWSEVEAQAAAGKLWCVVDGYVLDVTVMRDVHPGGHKVLERWAGEDASRAFHAANHSQGSLTFALNYRIGRVTGQPSASDAPERAVPVPGD